jgi:3-isopropylmalate dehydrogenase
MMLRHTGHLEQEADEIEEAIRVVLKAGYRTPDIAGEGMSYLATTSEIGQLVCDAVAEIAEMRHAYHAV